MPRGINAILQDELGYAINVALRECYMGGARSKPLPRRHQTGCSEPQQPAGCARAAKTRVKKCLRVCDIWWQEDVEPPRSALS